MGRAYEVRKAAIQKNGAAKAKLYSNFAKEIYIAAKSGGTNIEANDKLKIEQVDNKIIITKSNNNKISLKERFDNYNGENHAKDFSWDENVGKEIW